MIASIPRLITLLAFLLSLPAAAQGWQWAQQGGGGDYDGGSGAAVDATGNVYVTGHFQDTTYFGPFALTAAGSTDAFLVKYSPTGEVLWARSGGSWNHDNASGVAVDDGGDIYVTGDFRAPATFGAFTLTPVGGRDVFLVKYSSDGEVLWARSGGGGGWDVGNGAAVDAGGHVYVTGEFQSSITFGSFTLNGAGSYDTFLVKYSPAGEVLWARSGGGTATDKGRGVAVDAGGNAYVTGEFYGTATFGSFTLNGAGSYDVFLVKYSPEGDALWALSGGGAGIDVGYGVAADASGSVYISGGFRGQASFGPFSLTSAGYSSAFLTRYTSDGDVVWARSVEGATSSSVAVAPDGSVHVTGTLASELHCGADVSFSRYSTEGDLLASLRAGGTGSESARGLALDAAGNAFATGSFSDAAPFGNITLVSAGGSVDAFVAKYDVDLPAPLTAAPVSPPLNIPPEGGSFQFTVTLRNTTSQPQTFQAWTAVTGPVSRGTVIGPKTVRLPAGATITQSLTQQVPSFAPPGAYTYHVRTGAPPCSASASASFTFEKGASALTTPPPDADAFDKWDREEWDAAGWEEAGGFVLAHVDEGLPGGYSLSEGYPNPSDGTTRLTLEVAKSQHVTVTVYDALGRRIATLHDGPLAAGEAHRLAFDEPRLPAGVYVVRAVGETFADTRALTLTR